MNTNPSSILLVALRHLQNSIERGQDLSEYQDIADTASMTPEHIDTLCETLNTATTVYCPDCGTGISLPEDLQERRVGFDSAPG